MIFLAAFGAFVVAFVVTLGELVTTDYPRTFFLLTPRRSPSLYAYGAIYGAIAFAIVLVLDALDQAGYVRLSGVGLENVWIRALVVGLAVKAFLHRKSPDGDCSLQGAEEVRRTSPLAGRISFVVSFGLRSA